MWNKPQFDPYDVIVALDNKTAHHDGQITSIIKNQRVHDEQIKHMIQNQHDIRNQILALRQDLARTMELQIQALERLETTKN